MAKAESKARSKREQYWLVKTEPEVFSVQDWAGIPNRTTCWDGVRNYQARNFLRDSMQLGDRVLVYHSNAQPCAIVGVASVASGPYPDHTAFDSNDPHYDPKSDPAKPTWTMVDLRLEQVLERPLTLEELKGVDALAEMELLRRGSRLSVQPVTEAQWKVIAKLAKLSATKGSSKIKE